MIKLPLFEPLLPIMHGNGLMSALSVRGYIMMMGKPKYFSLLVVID